VKNLKQFCIIHFNICSHIYSKQRTIDNKTSVPCVIINATKPPSQYNTALLMAPQTTHRNIKG